MRKVVSPEGKTRPAVIHRLLDLLCRIKVIPVSRDKTTDHNYSFNILSLPTLLSTLWFWVPLSYYLYFFFCWQDKVTETKTIIRTQTQNNTTQSHFALDNYIEKAFIVVIFLLILLLPGVLGYFFALNGPAIKERKFVWPRRGWMLVLSFILFIVGETTPLALMISLGKAKGAAAEGVIHAFVSHQLMNLTAALLQLVALLVVSGRQAGFVQATADSNKFITPHTIRSQLQDYENIRQGVGPFNALVFSIHAPIILCLDYFGMANPDNIGIIVWSSGSVAWSCLILIHICLMSEDCYDVVQDLMPQIR